MRYKVKLHWLKYHFSMKNYHKIFIIKFFNSCYYSWSS